jgi:GTP diphosphokinase / guanosine-3',5'-bis(diphosphate) 3'-diphosphatase
MIKLYELELEKECPYGKDIEDDLQQLLDQCRSSIDDFDEELITKAFRKCVNDFAGQIRSSGDPFYTHPLKVAMSLMKDFDFGENNTIAASLLHDSVEDNQSVTIESIQEEFGSEIARIVDGVTKIKGEKTRKMDKAATYKKLFEALVQDVRVILIKLADRLDNMRTLYYLSLNHQQAIGHETLNFYTPFAQRLGLIKIKMKLEDLALYFTDRTAYNEIKPALDNKRKDFLSYIQNFYDKITQKLKESNIDHVLTIEHKHVYEIFKMLEQGKTLNEIDNFYSMVITLNNNDFTECYRTYGIIANLFGPVSSLDDYIARPRINLYRALHSTHFGPGRKFVEVIIRTEEMDKIAESGIAAMFRLKENHKAFEFNEAGSANWISWMEQIIEENDEDAIEKIWGSIRMNLYQNEITVHTKDGNSYSLPRGSCPLDLAFAVSYDTGIHCISSKVNGHIKSLNYELDENDQVELISSPNSLPSPEWQDFVITHKAVVSLYNYFKNKGDGFDKEKIITDRKLVKFRIIGEDRSGMLNDITNALGEINIQRINLASSNSVFEGAFTLSLRQESSINSIFAKLLNIKGLKGVERIDDE